MEIKITSSILSKKPDASVKDLQNENSKVKLKDATVDSKISRSASVEKGIHGLGGRLGTTIIDPKALMFDDTAQFFTVTDPLLAKWVNEWLITPGVPCIFDPQGRAGICGD